LTKTSSIKESSLFAFDCSQQGASHIKEGKVCQDFAVSSYANKYAVTVVCDGHGGERYFRSDTGSRFAGETALDSIRECMKECTESQKYRERVKTDHETFLKQLEKNILYRWIKKVDSHFNEKPFTEEELNKLPDVERKSFEQQSERYIKAYGTTLIAVVLYPGHFWFGLHIGDGKCVAAFEENRFEQPIPWDDKCFLNVTTSLCDGNASSEFRHCFHTDNFPQAIFVGSDGVDDSFANDTDLHGFYSEIIKLFQSEGKEKAVEEIRTSLPEISQKGSQDDISVAGIINFLIFKI
jgi:serine/threonine protein phosphatase PrpC